MVACDAIIACRLVIHSVLCLQAQETFLAWEQAGVGAFLIPGLDFTSTNLITVAIQCVSSILMYCDRFEKPRTQCRFELCVCGYMCRTSRLRQEVAARQKG